MSGNQDALVLFANEAFYLAFRNRDLEAMRAVWAEAEPIACIHPGWAALQGHVAVMDSWAAILGNPGAPEVARLGARVFRRGDQAFVTCYEAVGDSLLSATNIFVEENAVWKMVHHHAGPCHELPAELAELQPEADSLQ